MREKFKTSSSKKKRNARSKENRNEYKSAFKFLNVGEESEQHAMNWPNVDHCITTYKMSESGDLSEEAQNYVFPLPHLKGNSKYFLLLPFAT